MAVEIDVVDPPLVAARWAAVLGGRLDETTVWFDEGSVRFVAAGHRGEGLSGIDLATENPADRRLEICGTAVRMVSA